MRTEFATRIDADLQARFAVLLRSWRGYLPEEIWFEELLNLPPTAQTKSEVAQDLPFARDYFVDFARLCEGRPASMSTNDLQWFDRVGRRAVLPLWQDEHIGDILKRLNHALRGQKPDYQPPLGFKPALIRRPDLPVRKLVLRQRGDRLEIFSAEAPSEVLELGSLLGQLTTRNGLVQLEDAFWKSREPPPWADDWGTDAYGHWVTFSIEDEQGQKITQRMRWIAPGTFLMGAPEDEPERWKGEGPQHPVTISQGFWLFDTACTQALWQAVMGKNRSHFKGMDRPVENVSWNDVQHFIERLNAHVPGLKLELPSETQWEYACRAGTTTPFSFGANITSEQVNYNGNFPYEGGEKGRYRKATVPVGSLPPNAWRLYEMHGNVWEWVQDAWHDSYEGAPTDGSAWGSPDPSAGRVVRGGSWDGGAGGVRSAYRYRRHPGTRHIVLGFRCARVQVGQAGEEAAEPVVPALVGRGAERPITQGPPSEVTRHSAQHRVPAERCEGEGNDGPTLLRLDIVTAAEIPIPKSPAFLIHTDRERLTFGRTTKPNWAGAIGRDRYGLWTEIAVKREHGAPVIQRLRWIPPERFLMGSPENERRELAKDKQERKWFDREGPQHQVIISQGYWLFDTPCTQALWQAVMGDNSSRFKSPDRPVEQVSWDDVQGFLEKINSLIPGLELVLPTEAQWEYACRAGTETALYTGDLEILGENNAPALDPIAWYGGNSGVDFELENGYDSSSWEEKQYPHKWAGTRPVGLKQVNPWGLYDMLGNVWEWCRDGMQAYRHETEIDPLGPLQTSVERVIRGGSWSDGARLVRSAFRGRVPYGNRYSTLGFRCAQAQEEAGKPRSRGSPPAKRTGLRKGLGLGLGV